MKFEVTAKFASDLRRLKPEHLAEFDRWLAEVTKEAYLDGLRDGIMAARRIADYIAGMTDWYALDEHRRLFDATPSLR